MCNLKKWYKRTYLQNRNRVTDVENKHGYQGERGGDELEIVIDIYTLIGIKQITNKNLLYKKTNKQNN